MAEGGQDKTEKPSARRLSEARRKGQIAKSNDVNTAVAMLTALVVLKWQLGAMGSHLAEIARTHFSSFPKADLTPDTLMELFRAQVWHYMTLVGPTIGFLLLAGLAINYAQVGVLFTSEPLMPKLEKLNPIPGLKRMVSRRSIVETVKALFKMAIVAWIMVAVLQERYPMLASTIGQDHTAVALVFADTAWLILVRAIGALVLFGVFDYFYQRWEHEKGLRMTKQEVKDEAKQTEGSPEIKGRIRRLQREAARRRMMSEVPKATVVITNPTHYAVALKYDRDTMPAPKVVAKGTDLVAQKIKELAAEANVPMVENVPLARALHKQVEIDEEIPEDLYAAVAEILVMVQRLNKKKKAWR